MIQGSVKRSESVGVIESTDGHLRMSAHEVVGESPALLQSEPISRSTLFLAHQRLLLRSLLVQGRVSDDCPAYLPDHEVVWPRHAEKIEGMPILGVQALAVGRRQARNA